MKAEFPRVGRKLALILDTIRASSLSLHGSRVSALSASDFRVETGVSMSIEWMARIPLGCARGSQHEQHMDGCRTEIKRRVAICQSWPVGEIELLELETITNETYGKTYWLCEPRTCAWRFKFFHLALISLEVSFTMSG